MTIQDFDSSKATQPIRPIRAQTAASAARTAIVTGGASGIGRATAQLLAEQNVQVFVADIDFVPEFAGDFEQRGIEAIACDVRCEADVMRVVDRAVAMTGRLDVVVNSAGVGMVKQIVDVTEEEWDLCLDVNLKGAFLFAKHSIPILR